MLVQLFQLPYNLEILLFLILSQLDGIYYLEDVGRVCTRVGLQPFSKDEAKNACSLHENCVGYMNKIFDDFQSCDPISGSACNIPIDEDKGEYLICFNNGITPFVSILDVEGREDERIKMYKKADPGNDLNW